MLQALTGGGAMVVVAAGLKRVGGRWGDRVGMAAVNGVDAVVVSGEVAACEELMGRSS